MTKPNCLYGNKDILCLKSLCIFFSSAWPKLQSWHDNETNTLSWSVYLTLEAKGGKPLVTNGYQICQLPSPRVAGQSKPLPACEQLLGTTVWSWVSGRSQSGRTTPEFTQHSYCLNTSAIFIRKKCPRYLKYCSTRKSFLSTYTSPFRKSPMGFFNPAIPN